MKRTPYTRWIEAAEARLDAGKAARVQAARGPSSSHLAANGSEQSNSRLHPSLAKNHPQWPGNPENVRLEVSPWLT
jgi:hypothetical protein